MTPNNAIPPGDFLNSHSKRKGAVYVLSFFDGMLHHHVAALDHALGLCGGDPQRIVCIVCCRDHPATPANTESPYLLDPQERRMMLAKRGFANTFRCRLPYEHNPAGSILSPDDSAMLQNIPAAAILPAADVWGLPFAHHVSETFGTVTGSKADTLDDTFRGTDTSEHERMRWVLAKGYPETFFEHLGYAFPLSGYVVEGNKIGRTLGYPTANLRLADPRKITPGQGVYAALVKSGGEWYESMVNIGIRPTLDMENVTIEAHLFDFSQNIYGKQITIAFLARIRDEMRFNSLAELKMQLSRDHQQTKGVLGRIVPKAETNGFVYKTPRWS